MAYDFDTSFNIPSGYQPITPGIAKAYDAAEDKKWSDIFSSTAPKNDDNNIKWGDAFRKASLWFNRDKYQNQATTPRFFNINPDTENKSRSHFKIAPDISILPGTQAGQFTIPGAPGRPGMLGPLGALAGAGIGTLTAGPAGAAKGFLEGAKIGGTIGGIGDQMFMA